MSCQYCHWNELRFEKLSKALPIGSMDTKYKRMIATFKGEMERTARYILKIISNHYNRLVLLGSSRGNRSVRRFHGTTPHRQVSHRFINQNCSSYQGRFCGFALSSATSSTSLTTSRTRSVSRAGRSTGSWSGSTTRPGSL